jgi:hypothetical protein
MMCNQAEWKLIDSSSTDLLTEPFEKPSLRVLSRWQAVAPRQHFSFFARNAGTVGTDYQWSVRKLIEVTLKLSSDLASEHLPDSRRIVEDIEPRHGVPKFRVSAGILQFPVGFKIRRVRYPE